MGRVIKIASVSSAKLRRAEERRRLAAIEARAYERGAAEGWHQAALRLSAELPVFLTPILKQGSN